MLKEIICPKCNKPTKRMKCETTIALSYYDEEGGNANPDKNAVTTAWMCLDCNHKWGVGSK